MCGFRLFAMADPMPNLHLLDRFLVMMERQGVEPVICFNKSDIVSEEEEVRLMGIYEKCVNQVLSISTKEKIGLSDLQKLLEGFYSTPRRRFSQTLGQSHLRPSFSRYRKITLYLVASCFKPIV